MCRGAARRGRSVVECEALSASSFLLATSEQISPFREGPKAGFACGDSRAAQANAPVRPLRHALHAACTRAVLPRPPRRWLEHLIGALKCPRRRKPRCRPRRRPNRLLRRPRIYLKLYLILLQKKSHLQPLRNRHRPPSKSHHHHPLSRHRRRLKSQPRRTYRSHSKYHHLHHPTWSTRSRRPRPRRSGD